MIVTIDGPAGSGKSTMARELAMVLGIAFLDSGATYRAVTLKAMRDGVNLENPQALASVARAADIRLSREQGGLQVLLDGRDVTSEIRLPEVTDNIHYIARPAEVRDVLVELQRRLGREMGSFVAEGRDQGSVVFPQADYKFYLDASPKVRAERRYRELLAAGQKADHREIFKAVLQRDQHDMGRQVAPLVRPTGAIEIDTSLLTIPRVVEAMLGYLEGRR